MSNTAKERMDRAQAILDEYEQKSGLPNVGESPCTEDELNEYLSMCRNDIEALSPSICDGIIVRLSQSSIYIRRLINKEKSRFTWANNEILRYICDKVDSVGGQYSKYDVKVSLLAKEDNYISSLLYIKNHSQERVDRLFNLSEDLNSLRFAFLEVKKTKIFERKTE